MKTIVCGSRDFADYALLKRVLDKLLKPYLGKGLVLLSGGASGADKLGERWAFENLVAYRVYHPAWAKCGKAAGMLRNQEMVDDADACVAFWDGRSKGTADTIRRAKAAKLKLKVIQYTPEETHERGKRRRPGG